MGALAWLALAVIVYLAAHNRLSVYGALWKAPVTD